MIVFLFLLAPLLYISKSGGNISIYLQGVGELPDPMFISNRQ